ncbi:MAG: DUF1573 domain-containing protein [Bacteroidota bacterium]
MNRSLILLLAFWMMAQFAVGQGKGRIRFKKTRHNFGTVKEENGLLEVVFPFENAGTEPIVLKSVKASCGCTTPLWSNDSVGPGSQGFIKVRFNPQNRPGSFSKPISVVGTGTAKYHTLTITGRVTPRPKGPRDIYPFVEGNLRMRTNHLTYGTVRYGKTKSNSTILYNQSDHPMTFDFATSKIPAHLAVTLSKDTLPPNDTLTLRVAYDGAARGDWGFLFDNIFLKTNDPLQPLKRLNISAKVLDNFPKSSAQKAAGARLRAEEVEHDFGKVPQGEMPTAIFPIRNSGKSDLYIRKIYNSCACTSTAASQDTIAPGETAQLLVTFNTRGRIGQEAKEVTVTSNDPYRPELILRVRAQVVIPNEDP